MSQVYFGSLNILLILDLLFQFFDSFVGADVVLWPLRPAVFVMAADVVDVFVDFFGKTVSGWLEHPTGCVDFCSAQNVMAAEKKGNVFHAFFRDDDLTFAQLKDADISSLKSNFTPKHPR